MLFSANSFEDEAPKQCDALIAQALKISPEDIDARLSLASIRMSQSLPDEAFSVVKAVALEVLAQIPNDSSSEQGDETEGKEEEIRSELPPIPTRSLLSRLLLEHHLYAYALSIIATIRDEDELDVEGAYLEGWAWFCRGEALGAGGEEAEKAREDAREAGEGSSVEGQEDLGKEECWQEALASLIECRSVSTCFSRIWICFVNGP